MVTIRTIDVEPPIINTSCAWASHESQLEALFDCPHTGAVTTRTATRDGFDEDTSHTAVFLKDSLSSLNTYGYSPHPLSSYVGPTGWVRTLLARPGSSKPFIISITASQADDLRSMIGAIQDLRTAQPGWSSRVAVELNTSCPNIPGHPPPAYDTAALTPLLDVLAACFWASHQGLAIGIKLPPYVVAAHIADVVRVLGTYSRVGPQGSVNPFAFLTCTNTLGNTIVFPDQIESEMPLAGPSVGALAGEAIHALSLGNVYAFSKLLAESQDPALRDVVIIGAGGVASPKAVARMHCAGAKVVGCATLLGKLGVAAFEQLAGSGVLDNTSQQIQRTS